VRGKSAIGSQAPNERRRIWKTIQSWRKIGKTVVVSLTLAPVHGKKDAAIKVVGRALETEEAEIPEWRPVANGDAGQP
jgi:hypothetical protein